MQAELTQFVAIHGVWLVAAFIALESMGAPLPAEAALIAAGIFAATTHQLDVGWLVATAIPAAILGNLAGFWIGRKFGYSLLKRYGKRIGLNDDRVKIGQWLFVRYGGRFVFIARFLPFLRNMAAVLAGTNAMAQQNFYAASAAAAVAWIMGYGLAAYFLGAALVGMASTAAMIVGCAAVTMILLTPAVILRYEKQLLKRAERELAHSLLQQETAPSAVDHSQRLNAAA